jgi:hypothetical protein
VPSGLSCVRNVDIRTGFVVLSRHDYQDTSTSFPVAVRSNGW